MEPAFNVPLDAHMLGCTSCVSFENRCGASCFSSATASGTNDIGSTSVDFLLRGHL